MNIYARSLQSLACAALLAATGAAQAGITVYTSQSSYLAAISAVGVDTYDDLEIDAYDTPMLRHAGAYTYLASSGPHSVLFVAGDGKDHYLSHDALEDHITYTDFSANVRGVGGQFFGNNLSGNFTPGATIVLTAIAGSDSTSYTIYNSTKTSFFGIVSSGAITSLTLSSSSADVWATANNLTLGVAAVPEPETYALLLAGLALVGVAARRQRQASI